MNELIVGLDAWVIQDGNYDEFRRGESYKLALEFDGSALIPSAQRAIQCEHKGTSLFNVVAQVIFSTPEVWAGAEMLLSRDGAGEGRIDRAAASRGNHDLHAPDAWKDNGGQAEYLLSLSK